VIILKWKYRLEKVRRIYENYAQNLQVTRAEFVFFWRNILTTLSCVYYGITMVMAIVKLGQNAAEPSFGQGWKMGF